MDTSHAAPAITIRRADIIPLALPLAKPVLMAGVRVEHGESLLVRVESAGGVVGWGEASAAPTMTGDTLAGMTEAAKRLPEVLAGRDALRRGLILNDCRKALGSHYSVMAGVEMALLDLVGRSTGVPVCELLGGAVRTRMETMAVLGSGNVEEDVAAAVKKAAAGFTLFKQKIGVKPIADDIRTAQELRRALPEIRFCADANMGLTFADALAFAQAVEGLQWSFLEQPFGKHDVSKTAELAARTHVPLGADESIGSLADLREYHRAGAAQGAALKAIKMGGIMATVHAANLCAALGMNINLSTKMGESSIGGACLVHIGATLPETAWGVCPTNQYLAVDSTTQPLLPARGAYDLPPGPGLGVEVDEAIVAKYTVR